MKVRELVAELLQRDQDAECVQTSGMGWPTFNPLQSTVAVNVKSTNYSFPFWYEKVDEDFDGDIIKTVVFY